MIRLSGWRSCVAVAFLLTVSVAMATLFLNRGSLPTTLARQAAALLETQLPLHVQIDQARFDGPLRLVLEQVVLTPRNEGVIAQPVTVDRVHLSFSLSAILGRRPLAGLRQISLISPRITLDSESCLSFIGSLLPKTAGASASQGSQERAASDVVGSQGRTPDWPQAAVVVRRGQLIWSGDDAPESLRFELALHSSANTLRVKRLDVSRGAGQLSADGDVDAQGMLTAHLRVADWLATDLCKYIPAVAVQGRGTVSADLIAEGPWRCPKVRGQASIEGARLFSSQWPFEEPLPLVGAQARFSMLAGSWEFDYLELLSASGRLMGKGQLSEGKLAIEVSASELSVPADIPHLETWGIRGTGAFEGKLTGDVSNPVLAGRVVLRDGTLWDEPVSEVQGRIRLSIDRFGFDDVHVKSGDARYEMQGVVSGLSGVQAASLSIDLQASEGRIEQLFAVLGVDVDAEGHLDGTLSFEGPFGAVISSGDVTVRDVELFGEFVPKAEGAFRWGDGELRLRDVRAFSGQGSLVVDGSAALDGAFLRLSVDMNDWPLEAIHYAHLGQGLLSWSGEVGGSVTSPYLAGKLVARHVNLGKGVLQRLEGAIRYDGRDLESPGLAATTADGGSWWMSGKILDIGGTKRLAINLRIADQSLSSLLAMGGHRIPAALVDGAVHGTVQIEGSTESPRALLHLRLTERASIQADALELDLRIAERRVKILRVSGA
jgi:autotransporter translocation and assembly factor TamB